MQNRLKHGREAQGWSEGELTRWLGVSCQTINAVVTGDYDPLQPLDQLIAFYAPVLIARLIAIG